MLDGLMLLATVLLGAEGAGAAALSVHRCESPDGRVTYSDGACPPGTSLRRTLDYVPALENSPPPARRGDSDAAPARDDADNRNARAKPPPPAPAAPAAPGAPATTDPSKANFGPLVKLSPNGGAASAASAPPPAPPQPPPPAPSAASAAPKPAHPPRGAAKREPRSVAQPVSPPPAPPPAAPPPAIAAAGGTASAESDAARAAASERRRARLALCEDLAHQMERARRDLDLGDVARRPARESELNRLQSDLRSQCAPYRGGIE